MFNNTVNWDPSLSTAHISANLDSYESARTGFFTFIVDFANGTNNDPLVRATVAKDGKEISEFSGSDVINNAQEALKLNVTKSSVPHFSLEVLKYRRGNEEVKFAGVPTFGEGSLTVQDVVGLDTKSILMAWQALAYDVKTRKGGRMKDYKRTCTLVEYTQDYEKIRQWTLYGCWIDKIDESAFDKTADGERELTVSVQYDRAEMELPEVEE